MGRISALFAVVLLVLGGCGGGPAEPETSGTGSRSGVTGSGSASVSASGSTPDNPGADWPTYHRTNDRAGSAPGIPAVHALAGSWSQALDGAVYGQPLVLGDLVVAATENDSVYGLELTDGSVRWRTSLGVPVRRRELPCGNIDPLGITGTPAYDAATGSVFVSPETTGGHHELVALDAGTGQVRWRRSLDVTNRDRNAEQQRGALAVAGGRVYVPFGGLFGDCGNYVGYVTASPVTGVGPTTHYEVPTAREGGIWAPSGVAVDDSGAVWVAVGNGASTDVPYDGSDSVLRLAPDLGRRLDYFAPTNWGSENAADADLGSTGPLLLDRGRVLISGKTGDVYLLSADRLGGIGGQLDRTGGCHGFGGMAWDVAAQAAFVPCTEGVMRVDVATRSLTPRWRAASGVAGSPVLGGGAVFSLAASGTLHVLDEETGTEIAQGDTGAVSRFASPVLSGSRVLVPTLTGITCLSIS